MDTPTPEQAEAAGDVEALRRSLYADLLPMDQAAAALDVSRYTLSRWVSAGRFAAVQIGNGRYIARADIAEYIKRLRAEAEQRQAAALAARAKATTAA